MIGLIFIIILIELVISLFLIYKLNKIILFLCGFNKIFSVSSFKNSADKFKLAILFFNKKLADMKSEHDLKQEKLKIGNTIKKLILFVSFLSWLFKNKNINKLKHK